MPATKLANLVYRMRIRIPYKVPRLEAHPRHEVLGTPLRTPQEYIRLLRKHHVLGSAALLRGNGGRSMIFCSSSDPKHTVTPDSLFRVASITKMATALAALTAAEQGLFSLDDPFLHFFPECSNLSELHGVTPRQLLSHTSGLKDPENMEQALLRGQPFPEILPGCRISAPGAEFHYSNLGFGLTGSLLERVYRLPVSEVLKRTVFDPLDMRATLDASTLDPKTIVPITRIYRRRAEDLTVTPLGKIPLSAPDPLRHYGHTAGAMYLDLASLEKLTDCLLHEGRPVLRTDLGKEMARRHASYGALSPTLSYGLGLLRIEDPTLSVSPLLGHQGFAYGCADGAFWEEGSGRTVLFLNGGASEARRGRLGLCNYDILRWALREEMPEWSESQKSK